MDIVFSLTRISAKEFSLRIATEITSTHIYLSPSQLADLVNLLSHHSDAAFSDETVTSN